jgi:hypothetical protein
VCSRFDAWDLARPNQALRKEWFLGNLGSHCHRNTWRTAFWRSWGRPAGLCRPPRKRTAASPLWLRTRAWSGSREQSYVTEPAGLPAPRAGPGRSRGGRRPNGLARRPRPRPPPARPGPARPGSILRERGSGCDAAPGSGEERRPFVAAVPSVSVTSPPAGCSPPSGHGGFCVCSRRASGWRREPGWRAGALGGGTVWARGPQGVEKTDKSSSSPRWHLARGVAESSGRWTLSGGAEAREWLCWSHLQGGYKEAPKSDFSGDTKNLRGLGKSVMCLASPSANSQALLYWLSTALGNDSRK